VISLTSLPALNAVLNGTSALLLALGYLAIRSRRVHLHRACMVAAFTTSVLFLVSYLTYHYQVGTTRFPGTGSVRTLYLTILGTHTVLAAIIPPLAIATLVLAVRGRFTRHARLARWTLPTWLYVSVTGVVIYVMLYQLYAPAAASAPRAEATAAAHATTAKPAATPSDNQSGGRSDEDGSRQARNAASP
jgi:putative membrane protein